MHPALPLLTLLTIAQPSAPQLPVALAGPDDVASRADVERLRGNYSTDEWKALAEGKIISSDVREPGAASSKRSSVSAAGIVDYPPRQVWTVLTDFESRPAYEPSAKEVRIVRVEGNRVWLAERRQFFLVNVRFGLVTTLDPEHGSISWAMDEAAAHDIGGTTGSWQLAPLLEGRHTLVVYRAWFDTGQPIPEFIAQALLKRSLPQVLMNLRDEIERRFRLQ